MGTRKSEIIFEPLAKRGRVLRTEDRAYLESMGLSKVSQLLQVPLDELQVREFLDNFDPKKNESLVQGQRIIISGQLFESLLGATSGSDDQRGKRYLPPEREPNWPPEWPARFVDGNDAHDRSYGWRVSKLKPEYKQRYEWFGRLVLLKNTKSWTHLSNGAAMVLVRGEKGKCDVDWGGFLFRNFRFEIKRIRTPKSVAAITTVIGQMISIILGESLCLGLTRKGHLTPVVIDVVHYESAQRTTCTVTAKKQSNLSFTLISDATRQNRDGEVPELTCQPKRSPKLETQTILSAGGECSKECKDLDITPAIDINKPIGTAPSGEQLQHIGTTSIEYEQLDEQQREENVSEATNMSIHSTSPGFVGGHEELSRTHISGLSHDINSEHVCPSRNLRSQSSVEHVKEGCDKKRKRDADMSQLSVANVIVHQGSTAEETDEFDEFQLLEQEKLWAGLILTNFDDILW